MRIDISPGDPTWEAARPLLDLVWPPHIRDTLVWSDVVWSHAERRVMIREDLPSQDLVNHVGLFSRIARWNDRDVTIGGIGGVATHPDKRRQGLATTALKAAMTTFADEAKDFAVLFCEPYNEAIYRRLGWHRFSGDIFADQPAGRIRFGIMGAFVYDLKLSPRTGTIDLRGLPW